MTLQQMEEDTERPALAEILQEAWSDNNTGDKSADMERFHRLFQVLFQHCLLRPSADNGMEHVHLTLTLLDKRIPERPELLLLPHGDGLFYSWLVTRLLVAAASYQDEEGTRPLVLELCGAASKLLVQLGRDPGGDDTNFMHGPHRVAAVQRDLVQYATGKRRWDRLTADGHSTKLLGYDDMPASDVARLLALHVALQTPTPFLNETERAATALCDLGAGLETHPPPWQALYAQVVTAAVKTVPIRHALSRACVAVATAAIQDLEWEAAANDLLVTLESHGDSSLQADVWWSLLPLSQGLDIESQLGMRKILYLLRPAPPLLPVKLAETLLPPEALYAWVESVGRSPELRERLGQFIDVPKPTSVKRKREENRLEAQVVELLRRRHPELSIDDDLQGSLPALLSQLDVDVRFKLLVTTPSVACALAQCADSHRPLPEQITQVFLDASWDKVDDNTLMRALGILYHHVDPTPEQLLRPWVKPMHRTWQALRSQDRSVRLAAGNLISAMYNRLAASGDASCVAHAHTSILLKLPALFNSSLPIQETATLLVGDIGRNATDAALVEVLEILLKQFGSSSAPLRSSAYTQIVDIAAHRQKQPYNLLSPYLDRIGLLLAECLVPSPEVVAETMYFIGYTRQAFFTLDAVRKTVIPQLVIRQNRAALEIMATIVGQLLGHILIDEGPAILAKIFLTPRSTTPALNFVNSLLNEAINNRTASGKLDQYIRASIVPLVVTVVIELGDEEPAAQEVATQALHAVQRAEHDSGESVDLGAFLKPHMLGILATMTEQLMAPKTALDNRRKIIRSIGKLISLVGYSMSSFSPQVGEVCDMLMPDHRQFARNPWRRRSSP